MTKRLSIRSERTKALNRESSRAWRLANPERTALMKRDWYLRNCERVKAKSRARYRKNYVPKRVKIENPAEHAKQWWRNHYAKNRAKYIAKSRARYNANKQEYYRKTRAWIKANPEAIKRYHRNRRASLMGLAGKVSKNIERLLLVAQNGRCIYCQDDLTVVPKELDHRMPLSRGGKHEDSNLQLTCKKCNRRKGSRCPDEFEKEIANERKY